MGLFVGLAKTMTTATSMGRRDLIGGLVELFSTYLICLLTDPKNLMKNGFGISYKSDFQRSMTFIIRFLMKKLMIMIVQLTANISSEPSRSSLPPRSCSFCRWTIVQ
jgi:hypothetical protein